MQYATNSRTRLTTGGAYMPKLYDEGTNRDGLIVYAGEASSDYGMVIAEAPAFERARRKQTVYNVPGRNGAVIHQEDAWEDVPRNYKVWLSNNAEQDLVDVVDAFEGWLNSVKGYQRLEDSFEPDVFRLAYYSGGDSFTNILMQYGEATLNFTCRAERFLKAAELPVSVTNGSLLYNQTRYTSKPLIHIEGSGNVTLSIGGKTITANVSDYINIDVETMNAYRLPAENKNDKISGTFPTIAPGNNTVAITGSVSLATITPRFFTI